MKITAVIMMTALIGICAQASESEQTVRICMETGVDARALRAQAIASKMFADIDVRIEWRRNARCGPVGASSILVSLRAITSKDYHPGAMAFALPHEGVHIQVFYDRVQQMVVSRYVPALLAHVLAHEITHALQGIARHSETGIMRPTWESVDYDAMARRPLSFTLEDVRLIHLGLRNRAARLVARQ